MKTSTRSQSAFTLVETVVAGGVVAIVGGIVFTILNTSAMLYAQNVSINRTLSSGLFSTELLLAKVSSAAEAPQLVNDTGAVVTGNGPAAGIQFFAPNSTKAYAINSAVDATATTFAITRTLTQPVPQNGDKVTMADVGFTGVITSVTGSGTTYTIGFASAVGTGFSPVKTSGTAIPAGSKCFLLSPAAFIAVNGVLRSYPRAKSVAADGASAFNSTANFSAVATLSPASGQTNCFPFRYLDTARRSVDITLPVRAPAHGGRVRSFYTYQNLTTKVAFRTAVDQ